MIRQLEASGATPASISAQLAVVLTCRAPQTSNSSNWMRQHLHGSKRGPVPPEMI